MLKFITIPLSSRSVSYCHYEAHKLEDEAFISPEVLSDLVRWSMKENLSVQFLYPNSRIPANLECILESIDHVKIIPADSTDSEMHDKADVVVTHGFEDIPNISDKIYVVHADFKSVIASGDVIKEMLEHSKRVNIAFTDVPDFTREDVETYRVFLNEMAVYLSDEYLKGNTPQLNIITDRLMLEEMNNCNAGCESLYASLNGDFYPCPAFDGQNDFVCGNVKDGICGPNLRLFRRENAPICKICDAYNCRRCVWLNKTLTSEVNTPGWQQCYMAHLERAASRTMLEAVRKHIPAFMGSVDIPQLNYLDPFTIIEKL